MSAALCVGMQSFKGNKAVWQGAEPMLTPQAVMFS